MPHVADNMLSGEIRKVEGVTHTQTPHTHTLTHTTHTHHHTHTHTHHFILCNNEV